MAVEVEVKTFLTKEQYEKLLVFFKENGEFVNEDEQETYYFDTEQDLRIQRNTFYSKICLKKGKVHDETREEIEVQCGRNDFENLERLFRALGFSVEIKWFRTRNAFRWNGISAMVDYTKGYGYILELEKMSTEGEKEAVLRELKSKLSALHIPLTPREEFEKRFLHYKKNWKELVKSQHTT